MKRTVFILIGVILVLLLIGVWVYVLLTGDQSNGDRFADFGFGDSTDPTVTLPIATDTSPEPVVNVSDTRALRQLTTKPVAGFVEVPGTASSSAYVQYVESGTGHIYTIDRDSGEEKRISGTTIPVTTDAVITPNGQSVMIQAGQGVGTEFIIGTIASTSSELSNFALNEVVMSFAATDDNHLLYAAASGNNTVARQYNPQTNITKTLFTIPFRDVTIKWGHDANGPHLVYPKTAARLEGFVYSYTDGEMTRLPLSGYGVSASRSGDQVISSRVVRDGSYVSLAYSYDSQDVVPLPLVVIPEKCASAHQADTTAICGVSLIDYPSVTMPEDWYRGDLILSDGLWQIDGPTGTATFLVDIEATAGRSVDVIHPQFNQTDTAVYFQNKIDQTLWLYDLTI